MRKLLIIGIIACISFNGMIAISASPDNTTFKTLDLRFSEPVLLKKNASFTLEIKETNAAVIKPNMPILPSYSHTYMFPIGTTIRDVSCTPSNIHEINLEKELERTSTLLPLQYIEFTTDTPFQSEEHYSYDETFPNQWYEYDIGCGLIENQRQLILKINIYPVLSYASENKIKYAEHISLKIEYQHPQNTLIMNDQYQFLILTPERYQEELLPLADHKIGRDISTKTVTLEEIYSGNYFATTGRDAQENIKYFIKNAIEEWGITAVLLVGGSKDFPPRETHVQISGDNEVFVSDLYYADIYNETFRLSSWDTNENNIFAEYRWGSSKETDDIDLYPDVYLGRLACINEQEVTTCVQKIITYETNEAYTKDWFSNIVVVGGDSFTSDYGDTSGVNEGEVINEAVIQIMDGFLPQRLWASNGKLTGVNGVGAINDAINTGAGFVDFSGHGNTAVWATHPHNSSKNLWIPTPTGNYKNSHVKTLANEEKLPIVVIGACSTAKYNVDDDCFAWSFISSPNGGGIASFGATGLGYACNGSAVTQCSIEKMALCTFKAYRNRGAITVGEMWATAIESYIPPRMDGYDYKTIEEWQHFGDPTLAIAEESQPPLTPENLQGPTKGKMNTALTYTVSTTDPEGDDISYLFDWGDGTFSGWIGPVKSGVTVQADHSWSKRETYEIRVKAKDEHGVQSDWSDPITISMTKSISFINTYQSRFIEHHPLIASLLKNWYIKIFENN